MVKGDIKGDRFIFQLNFSVDCGSVMLCQEAQGS
jgi:hypothetical protein